jgi:hypothetical protein
MCCRLKCLNQLNKLYTKITDSRYQMFSYNTRDKVRLIDDLEIATGLNIVLASNKEKQSFCELRGCYRGVAGGLSLLRCDMVSLG